MALMRLDRFFSELEICSRTEVRGLVKKGLITINGVPASSSDVKINTDADRLALNGETVEYKPFVYIMLNKPQGVVSATDDKINRTVIDLVPPEMLRSGLFPAGRLDKDTEGFVLLTNDGDFAHKLLAPKNHVEKAYIAELDGRLESDDIKRLEQGVALADGYECMNCKINVLSAGEITKAEIIICEGKYHQIKRMFGVVKLHVISLKRVRMGGLCLDDSLASGECKELTFEDINKIFA